LEENKIKIFFCEIYDDGTVGGSHSIMYNLVTSLDKNRFIPFVGFHGENIYFERYEAHGIDITQFPDFTPVHFSVSFIRKMINWYTLIIKKTKYLENLFANLDIDLVVINNTLYTSEPYIKACMNLNIPIVIHERGINKYSKREIALSKYVSASIPMSDAIHKTLTAQGVRAKTVKRIYDGIDSEKIRPVTHKDEIKESLGIPAESRVIGIIGNVKPWKGQEYFVKSMLAVCKKYPDVHAVIVGAWKETDVEYKETLDRLIADANLESRILFTGYRTDVPDLLSSLDIFVHASTKPEPFGMVVIEAMAANIPVIATNFGGPVESLDRGNCGILVSPENDAEITAACQKYLNDSNFRKTMISLAHDRYRKCFVLKESVAELSDIYLKCISQ
jgi:L-malate glycosyltransferase